LQNGEFVFTPDTSRRGEKISLALNSEGQDVLVSKIYITFLIEAGKTYYLGVHPYNTV
jgi:hypothetical protein